LGLCYPTLIQQNAIPLILDGKDVLIKARTGSGKTAAFSIPIINKILNSKETATEQKISSVILAPSKELCLQASHSISHYFYS
jgi:ATP-dependent RNA helicase DDX56/DBP9